MHVCVGVRACVRMRVAWCDMVYLRACVPVFVCVLVLARVCGSDIIGWVGLRMTCNVMRIMIVMS